MMNWFGSLWVFTYTPLQVLGVMAIILVAIGVIMFFTTLWSVDLVKNEGPEIEGSRIAFIGESNKKSIQPKIPIHATVERTDREPLIAESGELKITKVRYSYDLMYLQILSFSIGDRHYVLDKVLNQKLDSDNKQIIMVGEYSCSASLLEDFVDHPYRVTFKYYQNDRTSMFESLNMMYCDELARVYRDTDFSYLSSEKRPDAIAQSLIDIRGRAPGLIDTDVGIRSLLFVSFYKLMDPGFRSVGLDSIQNFMVLMNMHIVILRIRNMARLFSYDSNYHFERDIVDIEDGLRRFIAKCVTSQKRQTDIHATLNRYLRRLRLQSIEQLDNANDTENTIDAIQNCVQVDLQILALTGRMYAEILVELADPDSRLYVEDLTRLYALLTPLYFLSVSHTDIYPDNCANSGVCGDDAYKSMIDNIVMKSNEYLDNSDNAAKPNNLLDLFNHSDIFVQIENDTTHANYTKTQENLNGLIQKIWVTYGLNRRALSSESGQLYSLLKN